MVVLGLDVGGANVKAATADGRAWAEPFALWKQPDDLAAVLVEMLARFPDAGSLAVTMTGELCDCYETKREGVSRILSAVEDAACGRGVQVWSTDGLLVSVEAARSEHMKVASANWHALATFAGRFAPHYGGLLLDVGSTTTDIIPLTDGVPYTYGLTDADRLEFGELVYLGVRRTPLCAVVQESVMAELFATTQDVCIVLGLISEDTTDLATADGRPATRQYALDRVARMFGGDRETMDLDRIIYFAERAFGRMAEMIARGIQRAYFDAQKPPDLRTIIVSGSGEFLARRAVRSALPDFPDEKVISLSDQLGPRVSACAPAFVCAVLAADAAT
jgi:probable H4MPT-linked C1 transfer pathway protein